MWIFVASYKHLRKSIFVHKCGISIRGEEPISDLISPPPTRSKIGTWRMPLVPRQTRFTFRGSGSGGDEHCRFPYQDAHYYTDAWLPGLESHTKASHFYWTCNLDFPSRKIMIKSVLQEIPSYTSIVFYFPRTSLRLVNKLFGVFGGAVVLRRRWHC